PCPAAPHASPGRHRTAGRPRAMPPATGPFVSAPGTAHPPRRSTGPRIPARCAARRANAPGAHRGTANAPLPPATAGAHLLQGRGAGVRPPMRPIPHRTPAAAIATPGPTPIGRALAAVEKGFSRTFGESGPAVGGTPGGSWLSSWQYAMSFPLLPVPRELELVFMAPGAHGITIHLRAKRRLVPCPDCGELTGRIHSRYCRTLADLPWHGTAVRLRVKTRRFFCPVSHCGRRIFAERLSGTADRYARRTHRLDLLLYRAALLLGGEAGSRLSRDLSVGVSPDTLLRRIRAA